MDAPGPFFFLVRDGLLAPDRLAPLLARLPAEAYTRIAARDGEAFDSTRWPVARDAALATWIARRFDEPAIEPTLAELETAADLARIRALSQTATARLLRASGADIALFARMATPTPADLAVFAEPPCSPELAQLVADLCAAHLGAAEGLFAYHVHRRLPGPGAEAAARLARRALTRGRVDPDALVAAALDLVGGAS